MISAMSAIRPRKPYTASRKIITTRRPTAPAIRPECSAVLPSVAETRFSESTVNVTGSVPDWICSASRSAWALLRPLISLLLPEIPSGYFPGSTVGVLTSWLSTTIALGSPWVMPAALACCARLRVMLWKVSPPPFL